jgi:hypothetical protein
MLQAGLHVRRRSILAVLASSAILAGILVAAAQNPAAAAVTSVKGSACSYYVNVGLFGGPQMLRGCGSGVPTTDVGYSPLVTLPPGGSSTAISASDADGAKAQYGPAVIHGGIWPPGADFAPPSGPQAASTEGTPAGGTVTSSADITLKTPGCVTTSALCTDPGGFGPPPVWGDSMHVECSASPTAVTGSTTLKNAFLAHATDADGDPIPAATEAVPDNPPVNYTLSGVITNVGDIFAMVFNQQIVNPDGSLTVNAMHMYLFGPTGVGELVRGQVNCGTTPSPLTATDTVAPTCGTPVVKQNSPTDPTPVSPREELLGVFDAGTGAPPTGLQSIANIHATNGTVYVQGPADSQYDYLNFTPGKTGPVLTGASRSQEAEAAGLPLIWSFDATDVAGNTTHCGGIIPPRRPATTPTARRGTDP